MLQLINATCYRYVSDVARRLSDATTGSQEIADLFTTNIESQRQKLRDHCEKLFFLDPLNYGKKSLELLWRKVYYDTVSAAKKLRESNNKYDDYIFTHIICGIGHFHHLMTKVQSEMGIYIKELDFLPLYTDDSDEDTQVITSSEEYQLGKSVLYSCLIYLGDLSRYQVEIFNTFESSLAARYYFQAAKVDLTSGMPFNQLGNLYLDRNYNLDSVCYYIHCLNTVAPFEGAMGNLTKIFEKNSQFCDTLNDSESLSQVEHMQATIANFLSLIEVWYFGKEDTNIPKICNSIAQQLKIAMDFEKTPLPDINKNYLDYTKAVDEENVNPSFMNAGVIHNIVQICLFTIAKLDEIDETKAFACKAFTLAFLSQVLQKLLKQLEAFGLKSPAHKYKARFVEKYQKEKLVQSENMKSEEDTMLNETKILNGDTHIHDENSGKENISESETNIAVNGENKNNKKQAPAKRRRRRRAASSDSTDDSDTGSESSGSEIDNSNSDDSDLSDSTFQSEDESKSDGSLYDGSDNDDLDGKMNESLLEEANKNKSDINPAEMEIKHPNNEINGKGDPIESEDKLNVPAIEQFLLGDNFLPSVKLLQDWALTEKALILSCGDSGESLFQCVVDLLNIFLCYFNQKNNELLSKVECKILDHAKMITKKFKLEYKSLPLPEDINLRGTNICKFDKDASEWQKIEQFKLTVIEENVVRILNFIDFGYQIAKIIPRIRFNRTLKIFYFKKPLPPKINTKIGHKKTREWHHSKKQVSISS